MGHVKSVRMFIPARLSDQGPGQLGNLGKGGNKQIMQRQGPDKTNIEIKPKL